MRAPRSHRPPIVAIAAAIAVASLFAVVSQATLAQPVSPNQKQPGERTPAEAIAVAVTDDEFERLDALVDEAGKSDARGADGRSELYLGSRLINEWFDNVPDSYDGMLQQKYATYLRQQPKSTMLPILEAIRLHSIAWRARGRGFASSVTPEGWNLFHERSRDAWKLLQTYKAQSSRTALWYQEAIAVAFDAGIPDEQIRALHDEGLQRFPGYQGIYFEYGRRYSPRWGGSWEAADAYIREQVGSAANREGDILYTRLYWSLDQSNGSDPDFFEQSLVDWARMRAGFEALLQRYPRGVRNQAALVSYACRAHDTGAYVKWRRSVDAAEFWDVSPQGISLEVCDARFYKKA